MVCAIIDIGSNTIKLCVYEYNQDNVRLILERKTMAGLANFIKNEMLSVSGIDRTCEILNEYRGILTIFNIIDKDVYIFATASLRNIVNTKEVIEIIKDTTGYSVEVISGEEEATLDFIGATKVIDNKDGILIDIGGGSTEIVVYKNNEIVYANSMPIGSLNLYVKHVKKIIPKQEERDLIKEVVLKNLKALEIEPVISPTICGVGGTIRAAAKLNNSIFNIPGKNINIEVSHISYILGIINNSKRKTITPILQNIPDRIHTIIPGLIILETIADYFNSENIIASKYSIREGYLYERVMKGE